MSAEYMNKLNQRLPDQSEELQNKTKLMYSCGGRPKPTESFHGFKNLIGLAILATVCILIIFKIVSSSNKVQIADFARNQEISKLLIGLMLLHNVKSLSNSFVNNLVLPIV